jgi:ribonuclease HI
MNEVKIYTMSSHKSPKSLSGKVIFILETQTSRGPADATWIREIEATPNEAAVEAVNMALGHVKPGYPVEIYTESPYVANGLGGWVQQWKENGWKTSRGTDIANVDGWKKMMELLEGREYSVHLKEEHSFRRWMETQLAAGERRRRGHV